MGTAHRHVPDARKQGATTKTWRSNGDLVTFQLGKTEGNHTIAYDRLAKRKAKGTMAPDKIGVRIERRLAKTCIWLNKLNLLPCVFDSLAAVKRVPGPPDAAKPYVWKLLRGTAEHMGLPAALALLPTDVRTVARKHLAEHVVPWWDTEIMWDAWNHMLASSELADANAWY